MRSVFSSKQNNIVIKRPAGYPAGRFFCTEQEHMAYIEPGGTQGLP